MTNKLLYSVLILAVIVFTISCSKEDTNPIDNKKFTLLQEHTWILDSTNTITESYNVMQPEIPASIHNFYTDSSILKFHNSIRISYGVSYQAPNKIYFWLPGYAKNENEFILIDSIDNRHLIFREIDILTNRTRVRYSHAQ